VQCQVANWFMGGSVYKLAKELYGNQEGSHATPSEVAVTQYVYPDAIKKAYLDPEVASGHKIYSSVDFRSRYPDGRMGSNPDLATAEHGKQFYDLSVEELSKGYLEFMKEE
jgi:creatinine amidohydrolase